jgi:AcrR family transcriptional regulator
MERVMAAQILDFPMRPSIDSPTLKADGQNLRRRILEAAHALYLQPRAIALADIVAASGVPAEDVRALFGDECGVRRAVFNELLAYALAGHTLSPPELS